MSIYHYKILISIAYKSQKTCGWKFILSDREDNPPIMLLNILITKLYYSVKFFRLQRHNRKPSLTY